MREVCTGPMGLARGPDGSVKMLVKLPSIIFFETGLCSKVHTEDSAQCSPSVWKSENWDKSALGAGIGDRKLYQKLHSAYLKRPPPVVFRGLIQRNSGGESVKLDWALNGGACVNNHLQNLGFGVTYA